METEISNFINDTLRTLKEHVSNENAKGARMESHIFKSAMDHYNHVLSLQQKADFREQYSVIMNHGGYNLINGLNLPDRNLLNRK